MNLVGYKSPGRRESRDKLRALARPAAVNCPDIFAEDKEFMRLFWASKRIDGDPSKRDKFEKLLAKVRARGFYLEMKAKNEVKQ